MSDFPNALQGQGQFVAAILHRLLSHGIGRTTLSVDDFSSQLIAIGYTENFDSNGLFEDMVDWLTSEGIIRFENAFSGSDGETVYSGCALTAKGLEILQAKLNVLDGKTTAEIIVASQKGDAPASSYIKAGSFLGGLAGGFIKSAGGG